MKLEKSGDRYILFCTYDQRHVPKNSGFRWCGKSRTWYTEDVSVACRLAQHAVPSLRMEFMAARGEQDTSLAESRAEDADITVPAPEGLEYMPFQRAGIRFILKRFGIDIRAFENHNEGRG